jgi:hypothetical protein
MKVLLTKLSLVFILSMIYTNSIGQRGYDTTTISLFEDIERIQLKFSDSISLTGTCYLQYIDSVIVYDTVAISYVVNGQQFKFTIDSIESIQNEQLNVVVYHQNKTVVIQPPVNLDKQLLGVDIHDPVFQKYDMKQMTKRDSGTYHIISIGFDTLSMYAEYEIVYHSITYHINEMRYTMRQNLENSSNQLVKMKLKFEQYKQEAITQNYFSTNGLILRTGMDKFSLGPLLPSDYEIISMLGK